MSKWMTFVAIAASCLVAMGCGQRAPYPMVKVSGTIRYDDGERIPADMIMIRFDSLEAPLDPKTHPRPGMATTAADGTFDVVTTSKYADGIIRGKHKVQLAATDAKGTNLIPPQYGDFETTPIEVDSSESPFDFKVPRP